MVKKLLSGGTNRAMNVNSATEINVATTAMVNRIEMDRPVFKSR